MADETDPLAEVKKELGDVKPPEPERESETPAEHEKQGEELRSIDGNVKKLCEDVESWKTETNQTLSELRTQTEALQQSIRELSEVKAPEPAIVAIAPAPDSPEPKSPENADGQKGAETAPAPTKPRKRFV